MILENPAADRRAGTDAREDEGLQSRVSLTRERHRHMRTDSRFIVALLALGLSACAGNPVRLAHDTKVLGSAEFLQDRTDCKLFANATAPVTGATEFGAERDQQEWVRAYYQCMEEKGWYPVDRDGNRVDYICNYFDCF